ncbi:Phosphoribosylglycinamide formyltransferase [invertebrate metagenome]|uniref:phosphoribosylglycinamide formyltransferase 1 n=1 Tax=invertebrate metagenome TaxID=1711999 RepID=A0A2H9TBZ3_9ZZZZ
MSLSSVHKPTPPIVVLLSGHGSTLQALIDQQFFHHYRIAGVISNIPDAFGIKRAQEAGIPTAIIDHTQYPERSGFEQRLIEQITVLNPDFVVLAGFMRILTSSFVSHYRGQLINIHPSLLPAYKGINTHQRVLDNQEKNHGTTIHFVTDDLDSGPVIAQAQLAVHNEEDPDRLQQRVQAMEHCIYPQIIGLLGQKRILLKDNQVLFNQQPLDKQCILLSEDSLDIS